MQITDKQAEVFEHVAKQLALGESPSNTSIAKFTVSEPSRAGYLVKQLVKDKKLLGRMPRGRLMLTKTGKERAIDLGISPAGSATEENAKIVSDLEALGQSVLAERYRMGAHWSAKEANPRSAPFPNVAPFPSVADG